MIYLNAIGLVAKIKGYLKLPLQKVKLHPLVVVLFHLGVTLLQKSILEIKRIKHWRMKDGKRI